MGHFPNQQPAGWVNADDWRRLYTGDTEQLGITPVPEPVPVEQPAKTIAKKPATRRVAVKKTTTKKQAAVVPPPEEEKPPVAPPQVPATSISTATTEPQQPENQVALDDDDQDDFLRQLEQDGADFEKSVQESDPWGFYA
ncbi:hypothetical protein ABW19_dt0207136 [Dactylella cylindrospora]|nr:hypothetical protein ABW19_dt0207136 [Dactylella cylindrospora]